MWWQQGKVFLIFRGIKKSEPPEFLIFGKKENILRVCTVLDPFQREAHIPKIEFSWLTCYSEFIL